MRSALQVLVLTGGLFSATMGVCYIIAEPAVVNEALSVCLQVGIKVVSNFV